MTYNELFFKKYNMPYNLYLEAIKTKDKVKAKMVLKKMPNDFEIVKKCGEYYYHSDMERREKIKNKLTEALK